MADWTNSSSAVLLGPVAGFLIASFEIRRREQTCDALVARAGLFRPGLFGKRLVSQPGLKLNLLILLASPWGFEPQLPP